MSATHSATPTLADQEQLHHSADMVEKQADPSQAEADEALTGVEETSSGTEKQDVEAAQPPPKATDPEWDWNTDPANPYNWSTGKKWNQVLWLSWFALSS
jgi:hypothetical protein